LYLFIAVVFVVFKNAPFCYHGALQNSRLFCFYFLPLLLDEEPDERLPDEEELPLLPDELLVLLIVDPLLLLLLPELLLIVLLLEPLLEEPEYWGLE
jgi:hypothetical protein